MINKQIHDKYIQSIIFPSSYNKLNSNTIFQQYLPIYIFIDSISNAFDPFIIYSKVFDISSPKDHISLYLFNNRDKLTLIYI